MGRAIWRSGKAPDSYSEGVNSNLGWDTTCTQTFRGFPQSLQETAGWYPEETTIASFEILSNFAFHNRKTSITR
jgi:hypothetical protein